MRICFLLLAAGCASTPPASTAEAGAPDAAVPTFGLAQRPTNTSCKPPVSVTAPAILLSQTGCADPADARRPAPGLIPYDVASPLWSDGASKERFLALPEGGLIRVEPDGHWTLPVGTVLVKTFLLGGRRIETRLLTRVNEFTWKGYSYRWNQTQSDADLVEDVVGGVKDDVPSGAGSQRWHFPSRAQCLQCHTTAAGVSLGPSTSQLNRDFLYPSGVTSNQLDTLAHVGVFETPPPAPHSAPLVAAASAAPVEERARSYLQVNCANCHRPGGTFEGIDLRAATPLAATGLCNQLPEKGDLGVAGARRLIPGDPDHSLVLLRMKTLADGRMPQLGTSVIDTEGVAAVAAWIAQLGPCP
jgi:uncharacterized repeat protein (TIGR03806 family)